MKVEPQCENCSNILIDEGEYVNKRCWECIDKRKIHECMGGKIPCSCKEELLKLQESPDTNDMEQLPNGDWRYKV